jgi:hypothetical protein
MSQTILATIPRPSIPDINQHQNVTKSIETGVRQSRSRRGHPVECSGPISSSPPPRSNSVLDTQRGFEIRPTIGAEASLKQSVDVDMPGNRRTRRGSVAIEWRQCLLTIPLEQYLGHKWSNAHRQWFTGGADGDTAPRNMELGHVSWSRRMIGRR